VVDHDPRTGDSPACAEFSPSQSNGFAANHAKFLDFCHGILLALSAGMTRTTRVSQLGLQIALGLAVAGVMSIATPRRSLAAEGQESPKGDALYQLHCAACHGMDATGNGPMTRALKHAPPDLTRLSQRNGGSFPSARMKRIVEGRDVDSHGDREMPIWGDAFRARGGARSGADDAKIAAILTYLESIQHREAQ
jgi:mono/diheme cytochrome c family protein